MSGTPHQSSNSAGSGLREAVHLLAAGLLGGGLALGAAFFIWGKHPELVWTPYAGIAFAAIFICIVVAKRWIYLHQHLMVWFVYLLLILGCQYLEGHYRLVVQQKDPGPAILPKVPAVLRPEDLVGSFSGFRTQLDGKREILALAIEDVISQPTRIIFHYAVYDGTMRTRGQGLIFRASSTLQFADSTVFRFERNQDGDIILRALNRDKFYFSRPGT